MAIFERQLLLEGPFFHFYVYRRKGSSFPKKCDSTTSSIFVQSSPTHDAWVAPFKALLILAKFRDWSLDSAERRGK